MKLFYTKDILITWTNGNEWCYWLHLYPGNWRENWQWCFKDLTWNTSLAYRLSLNGTLCCLHQASYMSTLFLSWCDKGLWKRIIKQKLCKLDSLYEIRVTASMIYINLTFPKCLHTFRKLCRYVLCILTQ